MSEALSQFVSMVPSHEVQTEWFLDAVIVNFTRDDKEFEEPRIIAAYVGPTGVTKYWFTTDKFARMCTQGLEMVKEVRKSTNGGIQVAKKLPSMTAEEAQQQATDAARDILKRKMEGR